MSWHVYTGPDGIRIRCEKRSRAELLGLTDRPDVLIIEDADWLGYLARGRRKSTRYNGAVEAMDRSQAIKHLPMVARPSRPAFGSLAAVADAALLRRQLAPIVQGDDLLELTRKMFGHPVPHLRVLSQDKRNQLREWNAIDPVEEGAALVQKQPEADPVAVAPAPSHSDHTAEEQAKIERQLKRTEEMRAGRRHAKPAAKGIVSRDTPEMVAARNDKRAKTNATVSADYDVEADVDKWFG